MSTLLSIIVPTYNVERYITTCLQSIQNNLYTNFECIIVDGASTDATVERIQPFLADSRFTLIRQEERSGVSAARNIGLDLAQGEYISFIDGDDYIQPQRFSAFIPFQYDIVNCSWYTLPRGIYQFGGTGIYCKIEDLDRHISILATVTNKIYKRDTIGTLRFDERTNYGEDTLFNICLFDRGVTMYSTSDPYYVHNVVNGSLSAERRKNKLATFFVAFNDKQLKNYDFFFHAMCHRGKFRLYDWSEYRQK